jgi:hypothetical protein
VNPISTAKDLYEPDKRALAAPMIGHTRARPPLPSIQYIVAQKKKIPYVELFFLDFAFFSF